MNLFGSLLRNKKKTDLVIKMYKTGPKFNDVSLLLSEHTLQLINFTEFFLGYFPFSESKYFYFNGKYSKKFREID